MTTDTKHLREAAFRVIDEGGPSWFSAEQLGIKDGLDIPEVDAQFIALASPKVIVDLIDNMVYPGSKIDGMKAHIALLKSSIEQVERENERLREALKPIAAIDLTYPYVGNDFANLVLRARAAIKAKP